MPQESPILPSHLLHNARSLFPHTAQGKIFLNHAGTSPLSVRVVAALTRYLTERSEGKLETYHDDLPMVAACRGFIQQLIHAESIERIALTANTTDAINIVATGIPWKSGDRIVLNTAEFPANVWPYLNLQRHGVRIQFIPTPDGRVTIDRILDYLKPGTRMLGLSAVQFLSGHRADLGTIGEICRSRGIIFAVDGIQAVGAVRINVQKMKIDALAAGGQKWQMAPHGTGFLYLTEELQSIIQQSSVGWLSVADPWDFYNFSQPLAAGARRYEGGSLIMPSLWGMHAALSTLLEFGMPAIERHLLHLTSMLMDGLATIPGVKVITPSDPDDRAGIVTISPPPGVDLKSVAARMSERRITIAVREGLLRYSPHFYCSPEDMEATIQVTREACSR